jgi:hypothetical protein
MVDIEDLFKFEGDGDDLFSNSRPAKAKLIKMKKTKKQLKE